MKPNTKVIITPEAEQDVRDILNYTLAAWGRPQRNAYFSDLKRGIRRIQMFPEIGHEREHGTREYALRHHVVLYHYENDTISILRVMHPRRLRG